MRKDTPIYKRVLLKLSGESFNKEGNTEKAQSIDLQSISYICDEIKSILDMNVEVALILGGGNILRGGNFVNFFVNRSIYDQAGMLATVINGLILHDAFKLKEISSQLFSSIMIPGIVKINDFEKIIYYLQNKNIVILVGGTGNPFLSTDSAASIKALEIRADILLKGTKVDGIYSNDPNLGNKEKFYATLTYNEILQKGLNVMDSFAVALCRDYKLPIKIFNISKKGHLAAIICGAEYGTLVKD